MDDTDLDTALARIDRATPVPQELIPLVERSHATIRPRRVTGRTRRGIALAAGACVIAAATVGAIGYQDYLLSVPPYVGLEDGMQRATTPLKVRPEYGADAGKTCRLYAEFRGLDRQQLTAVEAILATTDGRALSAQAVARATDQESYLDGLLHGLAERLREAVPGLSIRGAEPLLAGYTITCRDDLPTVG